MAKVLIIKLDWFTELAHRDIKEVQPEEAAGRHPIKEVEVKMPYDQLEQVLGVSGQNVIIDVTALLREVDGFRSAVEHVKAQTDRYQGLPL